MKKVAQLTHGLLSMELMSTEPGLQVYTGHKIGYCTRATTLARCTK